MLKDVGKDRIKNSYMSGKFQNAHFVCWNKNPTPENYILECDFRSVSEYSLHMIMFSHLGLNGESVFDPSLKPRSGIAGQYTKGDMVGYRIVCVCSFTHLTAFMLTVRGMSSIEPESSWQLRSVPWLEGLRAHPANSRRG
ncbi:DUF1961 family protein [Pontiella sulfatireligans]|uniref:Uncharacterized protein n=1 Tax=Pontiella sulfatireligans TaxID=2750658 RepID=A0A6C2UG48_9BACT|nr:hypothetical protein SCARR_00237 [Pontiella sulfatireligans]